MTILKGWDLLTLVQASSEPTWTVATIIGVWTGTHTVPSCTRVNPDMQVSSLNDNELLFSQVLHQGLRHAWSIWMAAHKKNKMRFLNKMITSFYLSLLSASSSQRDYSADFVIESICSITLPVPKNLNRSLSVLFTIALSKLGCFSCFCRALLCELKSCQSQNCVKAREGAKRMMHCLYAPRCVWPTENERSVN